MHDRWLHIIVLEIAIVMSVAVEPPVASSEDLLFSTDFLKECTEEFSVPSKGFVSTSQRTFIRKHLNIVDPLKGNNNLGRSVSRGSILISSFSLCCDLPLTLFTYIFAGHVYIHTYSKLCIIHFRILMR